MMMVPIIELKNISAGYENIPVVKKVNFNVFPEDFIGIIGPNGGGKTTLLKVILNLIRPINGEIFYRFKNTGVHIGYLAQQMEFDIQFPISVSDVILSGMDLKSTSRKDRKIQVDRILEMLNLRKMGQSPIGELSGGQRQKALLGRAIISQPECLILDEPDTYVDSTFENEMYGILKELNKSLAIIMVSHDVGMISSYVKTIACVNHSLEYHPSNVITEEQLRQYNCPIDIIAHGKIPHRVLKDH